MANRLQIQTALQKPYDRIIFAKEVLSPVFGSCFNLSSSAVPASVQPNKSEQAVIQSVSIYGNINLEDGTEITCYEINLQPSVRIEHSKVAIQRYVRKLLTAGQIALVNFIAPQNKKVWRLTLVAKDSELTEQGIKEKTTHAKRYTYLLGPSETCKTAAERFESLSTEKQITFQALVNAFSVEKLSKAFFDEYTLHYQKFCDYLQESNFRKSVFKISIPVNATKEEKDKACKPIRDFVKKLLGRIVFLYFVQKKGWLGASDTNYKDGLTDFIKQLFKQSGGNDAFYSTWLTVLFFETLNKERSNDDFKMPDGKKVKVPFLNGGLFDKEDHDEHILTFKSKLFHHPDFEDTLLTEKNRDNARGFLDFLDAFNFTVHEDSPDDHTVAVDPEMLGHIFENLLEDNKDKGAFYTPKEIVHYMCQESLTEYLTTHLSKEYTVYKEIGNAQVELFGNETKTGQLKMVEQLGDKALNRDDVAFIVKHKDISHLTKAQLKKIDVLLDTVKICDPAIGSGAFPMGLLQEIHAIKEVIAYELQQPWKPADIKENIIQNSVYGVDIEKGAVDIARLRFWLSLVVDEEKPRALPNLDYKIVVGDSLVSKFEGEIIEIDWEIKEGTQSNLFGNENVLKRQQLLKEITEKQNEYFHAKRKKKLAEDIRKLKIDILINQLQLMINVQGVQSNSGRHESKRHSDLWTQTQSWKTTIKKLEGLRKNTNEHFEHFDWKLDFPEILNPSLAKGNVGFDIVIANPPYIGQKGNNKIFQEVKSTKFGKEFHQRRMDYFYFFFHHAINISKQKGVINFITTNYYITATYADILRKDIKNRTTVRELINFNEAKIFESALGQHNIITILTKGVEDYPVKVINCKRKGFATAEILRSILYNNDPETEYIKLPNQDIFEGNLNYMRLRPSDSSGFGIESILNKIKDKGKPLSEICDITQGIVTGADKLSKSHIEKYGIDGTVGDGIFALSAKEVRQLGLNQSEKQFLKPWFKNSDVFKWITNEHTEESLIYYTSKAENKIGPNLLKHFEQYKPILINRNTRSGTPIITSSVYDRFVKGQYVISYVMVASAFKRGEYYCVSYARDKVYFESPKIVVPQRSSLNTFGYNESTWYAASDVHFIIQKNSNYSIKFILALLNSKLYFKWLYHRGKRKGETLELVLAPLSEIPIKEVGKNEQIPFIKIANYILHLKKQKLFNINDQLMPTYFEQIIDGMVYELYFPELIKKHNREIIQHLGELPEFTDKMSDEQKMKICKTVFNRLNDREHPVRVNLFYMSSIPEIAIIEGKNENN